MNGLRKRKKLKIQARKIYATVEIKFYVRTGVNLSGFYLRA